MLSEFNETSRVIIMHKILWLFHTFLAHGNILGKIVLVNLQSISVEWVYICQVKHWFQVKQFLHIKKHIYEPVFACLPILEFYIQIQFIVWRAH